MAPHKPNLPLHRFAVFTAVCTAGLVFAGGLVTSKDAGLSVPDWPLSYGMLMPPMVGNVRFEHGHRMVATFVGMLIITLMIWLRVKEPRKSVRRLGYLSLLTVVLQGVLGGLTVLLLLPTGVSAAHATLGQTFFCLVVSIALLTSPGWWKLAGQQVEETTAKVRKLALMLTALVYVQLIVGAVMRHSGAGLAIPDFPLMFGGLLPPLNQPGVAIQFAHRLLGLSIAVMAIVTLVQYKKHAGQFVALIRPLQFVLFLILCQVLLGGVTVWTRKAPLPTTFHVLNGALILATSLVVTLRSYKLLQATPTITSVQGPSAALHESVA